VDAGPCFVSGGTACGGAVNLHRYDIGGLLLSSLGGALVPVAAMPGWIAAIAPISPGYWAVSALRAAVDGHASQAPAGSAVLTGFAIAAALVTAWRVNRGWGRSAKL
jgi:ABC-2 type transport system permease protein